MVKSKMWCISSIWDSQWYSLSKSTGEVSAKVWLIIRLSRWKVFLIYSRKIVCSNEVYAAILDAHQRSHHAGYTKTFHQVQLCYYGISRDEVVWLLKHCTVCLQTRPSNTWALLEPIESKYTLQRVQIDLVDMRATPHNGYSWILHIKDYFSKFSFLYVLCDKTAAGVAKCIAEWLGTVGIPKIIQCDNGKEFKGILLILLKKYRIKILNGRPRHP